MLKGKQRVSEMNNTVRKPSEPESPKRPFAGLLSIAAWLLTPTAIREQQKYVNEIVAKHRANRVKIAERRGPISAWLKCHNQAPDHQISTKLPELE